MCILDLVTEWSQCASDGAYKVNWITDYHIVENLRIEGIEMYYWLTFSIDTLVINVLVKEISIHLCRLDHFDLISLAFTII